VTNTLAAAMSASIASTSAAFIVAAAPAATMIAFMPVVSSTNICAAPVETPSITEALAVMPSIAHVARAISPNASLPMRVQNTTSAPARAAATA
jgi:hypothetical protein